MHPRKAPSAITVTESLMVTHRRLVQEENVSDMMAVSMLPKSTDKRDVAWWLACICDKEGECACDSETVCTAVK
jgi:hypothetical protein